MRTTKSTKLASLVRVAAVKPLALAFTLVLATLAFAASPALASGEPHPIEHTGFETDTFSNPNGIAIDQSSSDVYVADIATNTVYKFDASGVPVDFSSLGSNALTGTPATSKEPARSFSFPETYGTPAAIAVDNSTSPSDPSAGDLYVMDAGHKVVDKFNANGSYLGRIEGPTPGKFSTAIVGVAVDANGNVLVDEGEESDKVREFDDSSENVYIQPILKPAFSVGFATDPADGIYSLSGGCHCVEKFDAEPVPEDVGQVDSGSAGVALAVDQATGHVYIDEQSSVAEWDAGEMKNYVPLVHGSPARGTLVSSFGSLQLSGSAGEGGIAVNSVTGDVYVSNPVDGKVYVFGTAVPGVAAGAATNVAKTGATLQGAVDPHGAPVTSCEFEYGTTGAYGQSVECAQEPAQIGSGASPVPVSAEIPAPGQPALQPGTLYHFRLTVGNASGTSLSTGLFATASPGYGVKAFEVTLRNKDGSTDTQAGSHPYEMTTNIEFNTDIDSRDITEPAGNLKDLIVNLPPGLIGDPDATVKCTLKQLEGGRLEQETETEVETCPPASQIGVLLLEFGTNHRFSVPPEPVYNMVPPSGVAVQFGAHFLIPDAFIDVGVPAGGDYGVRATVSNPSALLPLIRSQLTVWGTPQEESHDAQRICANKSILVCPDGEPLKPFLSLPTACSGPLVSTMSADSYEEPGKFASAKYEARTRRVRRWRSRAALIWRSRRRSASSRMFPTRAPPRG